MFKQVRSLTPADRARATVWEFADDMEGEEDMDETLVRPVTDLPVSDLSSRVVLTELRLADGTRLPAVLSNISTNHARQTRIFINAAVFHDGDWLDLARPNDFDYEDNGPAGFASRLGKTVDEVFPLSYDLSPYVTASAEILYGRIESVPSEILTDDEIIALARE